MAGIKISGLGKIGKKLKKNCTMDDVKRVVRHNGSQLQRSMQSNADFKMGYQTGTTKGSIGLEVTSLGLAADVEPTTDYSPYLEYGTRFMEAQPFIRPAYNEQKEKFKQDLQKLVK